MPRYFLVISITILIASCLKKHQSLDHDLYSPDDNQDVYTTEYSGVPLYLDKKLPECDLVNNNYTDFGDMIVSESSESLSAVRKYFTPLPEMFLDKFKEFGGEIRISRGFKDICKSGLFACWEINDHNNPIIYIPDPFSKHWEDAFIERSLLYVAADIEINVLERYQLKEEKLVENHSGDPDNLLYTISLLSTDKLSQISVKNGSESFSLNKNPDLNASDQIYSIFFVEYFCSDQTKRDMARDFPEVTEIFGAYYSQDRFNLTGAGNWFKSLLTKKKKKFSHRSLDFEGLGMETKFATNPMSQLNHTAKKIESSVYDGYFASRSKNNSNSLHFTEVSESLGESQFKFDGTPRFFYSKNADRVHPVRVSNQFNQKKPITIMVHGTWCTTGCLKTGKWANPDGDMAHNLRQHYGGDVVSFGWDGANSVSSRSAAADILASEILLLRRRGFEINLVGHSHGGNVIIEALNKVKAMKPDITTGGELVTLARPVRSDYVLGDKNMISYYAVAYGQRDSIQSLGGQLLKFSSGGRNDALADLNISIEAPGTWAQHNKVKKALLEVLLASQADRAAKSKLTGLESKAAKIFGFN